MESDKMFEMFEKKRNSIIKVTIILLIILCSNILINIPFVEAGRWVYDSTVEDVYNVTISSDDAVAVIDDYFSSNGESITLKSNIYSSIIGLRFDDISIPSNSTHEYRVDNSFISLYSDHYPYDPLSEKVTIYFERDNNNIQTFSNYTELVSRTPSYNYRNWDLDDVHGLNSTTGQWNDSPNIAILVTGATGFDNDTICFLIYSERGVWFRYFRTYDNFVDYAPRLHIISHIYEWQESPPSGYEDSDYVEMYRGFEIWEFGFVDGSGYDLDLTQGFTDTGYVETDSGSDLFIISSTHFNVVALDGMSSTKYAKDDYDAYGSAIALVHLNITDIDDGGASGIWEYPYSVMSFGMSTSSQWGQVTDNVFLLVCHHYDDNKQFKFWVYETTSGDRDFVDFSDSPFFTSPIEMWIVFEWIGDSTDTISYYVYNSSTLDAGSLLHSEIDLPLINAVHGDFDSVTFWNTGAEGLSHGHVWGDIYMQGNNSGWLIVDEDDNVIALLDPEIYGTIEDVEAWIDNYLSASPEYDKQPWMGDFTLLLVGLVGVAMIPIGFLIFVSSVRDGDMISGLTTLVLTFFIGMGCIVAWLWA